MRSNLEFIQSRIAQNLEESGQDVILTWNEWPANTPKDPVTSAYQGTPTAKTATVKAFIHFVPPTASSAVKLFNEFEDGDAILDLSPGVALDGREDLRFDIAGEKWEAKKIGSKLGRSWDVQMRGEKLYRSVLITKAA